MELFKKVGPRVILVEYHGKLTGLVTVKDCLKFQFAHQAAEAGHGHGHGQNEEEVWVRGWEERIWRWLCLGAGVVAVVVEKASFGTVVLGTGEREMRATSTSRSHGEVVGDERVRGYDEVEEMGNGNGNSAVKSHVNVSENADGRGQDELGYGESSVELQDR